MRSGAPSLLGRPSCPRAGPPGCFGFRCPIVQSQPFGTANGGACCCPSRQNPSCSTRHPSGSRVSNKPRVQWKLCSLAAAPSSGWRSGETAMTRRAPRGQRRGPGLAGGVAAIEKFSVISREARRIAHALLPGVCDGDQPRIEAGSQFLDEVGQRVGEVPRSLRRGCESPCRRHTADHAASFLRVDHAGQNCPAMTVQVSCHGRPVDSVHAFLRSHAYRSIASSRRFRDTPLRSPEREPFVFTIRWHGMTTASDGSSFKTVGKRHGGAPCGVPDGRHSAQ